MFRGLYVQKPAACDCLVSATQHRSHTGLQVRPTSASRATSLRSSTRRGPGLGASRQHPLFGGGADRPGSATVSNQRSGEPPCKRAGLRRCVCDRRSLRTASRSLWEASKKPLRRFEELLGSFWTASGSFSGGSGSVWEAVGKRLDGSGKLLRENVWQASGNLLGSCCKLLGRLREPLGTVWKASGKRKGLGFRV